MTPNMRVRRLASGWPMRCLFVTALAMVSLMPALAYLPELATVTVSGGEILRPIRWPKVAGTDEVLIAVVPVGVNADWPAVFLPRILDAVNEWNAVPGPYVRLVQVAPMRIDVDLNDDGAVRELFGGDRGNGRIVIYYGSEALIQAYERVIDPSRDVLGATIVTFRSSLSGERPEALDLLAAEMIIKVEYRDFAGQQPMINNREHFEEVTKHEIGHALGLEHTPLPTALMWYGSNPSIIFSLPPREDDRQGLRALYELYGDMSLPAGTGAFSLQLKNANRECPIPGDVSCWSDANGILVELFRGSEPDPLIVGITGWSFPVNTFLFQNSIFPGTVLFPITPASTDYRVRIRTLPVELGFGLPGEIPGLLEYPVISESWYFNAPTFLSARVFSIADQQRFGIGDAVGLDGDSDGVSNLEEIVEFRSDPGNPDSDYDGKLDGEEVSKGTPPLNARPIARMRAAGTVECEGPYGARVQLDGSLSSDREGDPIVLRWSGGFPEGGGTVVGQKVTVTLPLGHSEVELVASDPYDVSESVRQLIEVMDTTGPVISKVRLSPEVLWPPDHRMVSIAAEVEASDRCGSTSVALRSIISDEGDSVGGSGGHSDDIQNADFGEADFSFGLRAERSGGRNGRIYTVLYTATDSSGNTSTAGAEVVVPHDQGDLKGK